MAVTGVGAARDERQVLKEMPLARAFQYEVGFYQTKLNRLCYVGGSDAELLTKIKNKLRK